MSILQRNKKVAAGIGVAAAAAAALALGTGTFAAFSATATGPGGTLAAGTMVLDVNAGGVTTSLFSADNIYPAVPVVKAVTFKNNSQVAAYLTGTESLSNQYDYAGDGTGLKDQMTQSSSCASSFGTVTAGPALLRDVNGGVVGSAFTLAPSETVTCTFTFVLPDRSDNNLVQSDKIQIDSTFTLTQKI